MKLVLFLTTVVEEYVFYAFFSVTVRIKVLPMFHPTFSLSDRGRRAVPGEWLRGAHSAAVTALPPASGTFSWLPPARAGLCVMGWQCIVSWSVCG